MNLLHAVVLGGDHPSALAVIRSLGRAGIPVEVVDHEPRPKAFYSRYVTRKHVIASEPEAALGDLERIGRDGGGVVVPTSDHYLGILSRNFERLSRCFTITVPPWQVLAPLMDKARSYEVARELGLEPPPYYVPRDLRDLDRILDTLDFTRHQYVLSKVDATMPGIVCVRSGRAMRGAGRDRVEARAASVDVLERTGSLPMIIEVVPGEASDATGVSMVIDRRHEAVVCYGLRRMQLVPHARLPEYIHPYDLGWNVFCETVHDEEAFEAARRFVRHTRFFGSITIEFRRDSTSGRLKFIKADPRVERATALSEKLGMDVSRALYDVFTDRPRTAAPTYPDGVAWMWFTWYVGRLWQNRALTPFGRELRALVRKFPRVRADAYASATDPVPFVVDCSRWGKRWVSAAVGRIRRASAT